MYCLIDRQLPHIALHLLSLHKYFIIQLYFFSNISMLVVMIFKTVVERNRSIFIHKNRKKNNPKKYEAIRIQAYLPKTLQTITAERLQGVSVKRLQIIMLEKKNKALKTYRFLLLFVTHCVPTSAKSFVACD